jgi:adenylate cyclase
VPKQSGQSPVPPLALVVFCSGKDGPSLAKPNRGRHGARGSKGQRMASIFLSYARDDAPKANALAKCLERAGHSVWWDRHIHGGAEFAGEIETALRDAEVIVVLWSEASIRSAWVRDEAAEGRDSRRLVPLLLDGSTPPLGFRQLQTISIAGWSGRGNPPNLKEICSAVARLSSDRSPPNAQVEKQQPGFLRRSPVLIAIAALAALLAGFGAWWLLQPRSEESATPVLAVLPFADLSPDRDKAYFAEGVAEAILTVLAKEQGFRVIGRSTAEQLHNASTNAGEMRRALGVTHLLEGSARSIDDQLRMSVRLVDAKNGRQIWAEEYRRRLDNVFAVQDEIGRAVAQRLRGSFAPLQAAQQLTSADAYTLYLAARAKMRDRRASSLSDALKLARQVIATDPNYAPGHALYAELLGHMSYDNYGNLPQEQVQRMALPHARRAIQLAPNAAEGYAALGLLANGQAAIRPLETAIRLDPARAELRLWLTHAYNLVGRHQDALRQIEAAIEMEPLSPTIVTMLSSVLAASDRIPEANAVIRQFEMRGGSRARAAKMRGDIAAYYAGDYSEGIRLMREAVRIDPETPLANQSFIWFYHTLRLDEQAAEAASGFPTYTRLLVSGDRSRLLDQIRRDGARIWQQPDADVAIDALAVARDWRSIEALYDANREVSRQVCADNRGWVVQMGINIATALVDRGRRADGERLLDCLKSTLTRSDSGPVRTPYLSRGALDLMWAQIHAVEGNSDRVFPLLESAVRRGFRAQHGVGLANFPVFDGLRERPEYSKVEVRLKQLIAAERAEVLRMRAAA